MDEPSRSVCLKNLTVAASAEAAPDTSAAAGFEIRTVRRDDDAELGRLMERAYAGTIDDDLGDNSDGEIEVREWRLSDGRPDVSVVAVGDGRMVSACLISRATSGNW